MKREKVRLTERKRERGEEREREKEREGSIHQNTRTVDVRSGDMNRA